LTDADGQSLDVWRGRAGLSGATLDRVPLAAEHYAAFIELHIEQGPLLARDGVPIGIVEAIAGPSSYRLRLVGEGGHAGAVLMPARHDAGLAAAEIALAVERAAQSSGSPDTVGTTGVVRLWPGAINSIPAESQVDIDFRDTQLETRVSAWRQVELAVAEICARRGVRWTLETINANPPAICAPALVDAVSDACAARDLPVRRLISRAYHDALFMAQLCPTTMIFIPCRDGVSHRPDEYSSPQQIATGVAVLADVLARLASIRG
jgi:N-carbamoyl-L-amino-acid hydrolase